jgi:hypothetical protein
MLRETDDVYGAGFQNKEVISLKLDYLDLLSPEPVRMENVGGILSPKLRDVASIGYDAYQFYLELLLMDLEKSLSMLGHKEDFDRLSDEEKTDLDMFDLWTANGQSANLLEKVLNFFIKEEVVYSGQNRCFLIQDGNGDVGTITRDSYPQVRDIICQRVCIRPDQEEDLSKARNKKALEIAKKLQKGRSQKKKQEKTDKNMELGNIISAVANRSPSLNILNIWDLTVYQLWDCFSRISNNNIYDIQARVVAAWGNKDNHFDATAWYAIGK